MSFIPVAEYITGIFVFGGIDLLMNDIVLASRGAYYTIVNNSPIIKQQLEPTNQLSIWFWHGILVLYLIVGAFWLWRKYIEEGTYR